jgi:hypothetical protein
MRLCCDGVVSLRKRTSPAVGVFRRGREARKADLRSTKSNGSFVRILAGAAENARVSSAVALLKRNPKSRRRAIANRHEQNRSDVSCLGNAVLLDSSSQAARHDVLSNSQGCRAS